MQTSALLFVAVSSAYVYFHLCLLLKPFAKVEASLWTLQKHCDVRPSYPEMFSLPKDSASLPSSGRSLQNSFAGFSPLNYIRPTYS